MRLSTKSIDQLSHLCHRIRQNYGVDSQWGIAGVNSIVIITVFMNKDEAVIQLPDILKAAGVSQISYTNLDVLAAKTVELAKLEIVDSLSNNTKEDDEYVSLPILRQI